MGNAMRYIKSHGKRILIRYDAQRRALKFIEKEKLPNAPRHPAYVESSNDLSDSFDLDAENTKLHEHLKNVYVKSIETTGEAQAKSSRRYLPEVHDDDYAIMLPEPTKVEKGYCTLTQAAKFLAEYEQDTTNNNASAIAKRYNLDESKVEKIVQYYGIFSVYHKSLMFTTANDTKQYSEEKISKEIKDAITEGTPAEDKNKKQEEIVQDFLKKKEFMVQGKLEKTNYEFDERKRLRNES